MHLPKFRIQTLTIAKGAATAAFLITMAHGPSLRGQEPKAKASDEPADRLAEMRRVIDRVKLRTGQAPAPGAAVETLGPLHRWNDPTRQFSDATLWAWGTKGRPLALFAIELYPTTAGNGRWSCEVASLASGPLAAEFAAPFWPFDGMGQPGPGPGASWSPGASGTSWKSIPDAPAPAVSEAARLRQMRELAQRFTAHEMNDPEGNRQRYELRLLPRPVHRYTDPAADVRDGAMFLFASGTNPELALLLEARGQGTSGGWFYGIGRLSRAALFVQLDGREVSSQPYAVRPAPTDVYYIAGIARSDLP